MPRHIPVLTLAQFETYMATGKIPEGVPTVPGDDTGRPLESLTDIAARFAPPVEAGGNVTPKVAIRNHDRELALVRAVAEDPANLRRAEEFIRAAAEVWAEAFKRDDRDHDELARETIASGYMGGYGACLIDMLSGNLEAKLKSLLGR